jgi:aspartyl-tRNA(Asn)/glutamyl-tRNA(Gln) amidotransferase subunit C
MAQTITEELTRKTARLARLALTDEEVRTYARQLADIVAHVESLSALQLDGVEPMVHPHPFVATPLREDDAASAARVGGAGDASSEGFEMRVPAIL